MGRSECDRKLKLELPVSPLEWFEKIVEHHGLHIISLDLAICIKATELTAIHADPCDRLILATAQLCNLAVVTHAH